MLTYKNVILGAGLTGLSVGFHLHEESAIFEKDSVIGGLARSEVVNGFIFDYAPHILYTIDAYAAKLITSLLKDNLLIQKREAYIYHGKYDLYTRFPYQAHLYGLPASDIYDCLSGIVDVLRDPTRPKPKNYEEWIYWRFGKGIAEHLMIPYAKRIWTTSPSLMNFDWIDRRVPEPDFNVILRGALFDEKKRAGFNKEFWYPIEGGIEALPAALGKNLKNVNLNKTVTKLFPDKKQVEFNGGLRVGYERLVSTLPLPQMIQMIDNVPSDVLRATNDLQNNCIVCVNLGVARPNISPYQWLYFYEDDFIFHRMSFPMNFSQKTTPNGMSSICCEIAYSRQRPLSSQDDDAITEQAINDLIKAKILKKDDKIVVSDVLRIDPAYIIYDLNHRKNVNKIHSYLQNAGIYPCGRFGDWEYYNMDHSIMSGKKIADKINKLDKSEFASETNVL